MSEPSRTLSERETDVLRLLATGATNQQIADELVISVNTVKVHVRNIFDKLGAQSRTEATLYAIHAGLVPLPRAALDDATREAETARAPTNGIDSLPAHAANGVTTPTTDGSPTPSAPRRVPYWVVPLAVLALTLLVGLAWQVTTAAGRAVPTAAPLNAEGAPITTVNQRWAELAPLPTARGGLALTAVGESLYAIGGQTATGVSGDVTRYNANNTWTVRAAKPTPVRDVGAVVIGGQVYVPGGCDAAGKPVDVVEVYNLNADRWSTGTPLPRALCGYALAALDGKMYVIGGWDGQDYRNETLIYTPGASEWQVGPAMLTPRAYPAASVIDGHIYVIGGENGAPLASNEMLDPAAEGSAPTWTTRTALPAPRSHFAAAPVGRRIFAIGGGPADQAVASYDAAADIWRTEATPFEGQWTGLGVAASDLRLHAIGGDGPLAVNRAYQALFQITLPLGRQAP